MWRRLRAESGFWNTICSARRASRGRRRASGLSGLPCRVTTEPWSGAVSPSRTRASVVLPLPDSPTSPSVSPARIDRSTPARALTPPAEGLGQPLDDHERVGGAVAGQHADRGRGGPRQVRRLLVEVAARGAHSPTVKSGGADSRQRSAASAQRGAKMQPVMVWPGRRQEAGDGVQPVGVLALPAPRDAAQQPDRVRVPRDRRTPRAPALPRPARPRTARRPGRTSWRSRPGCG